MQDAKDAFERLLGIMNDLREKCPWDRKQTIESLRLLTIEETYELAHAIDDNDMKALKEELGDLLLHIVFYAKIASEHRAFDITEVINDLCEKLIRRHPHIYSDVKVNSEEDVKQNWEHIKMKERKKSVLEGVPSALPAMVKSFRIQDKAKQVGFEWDTKEQVWRKVEEELREFSEYALKESPAQSQRLMEEEFGDLVFSLVNLSRYLGIDPEAALEKTNKKFIQRFLLMEEMAQKQNQKLPEMSLEEKDALWNIAKEQLRNN